MNSSIDAKRKVQRRIISHSLFLLFALSLMLFQLHGQTLRAVASEEDYPPFYVQQGDTLSGFSVELLDAVSSQLGVTFQWQRLPWNRMMRHVGSGQADVIPVFYKTSERAEQFYFSNESYLRDPIVLLCGQPCKVEYDGGLDSIKHLPIAVVRGFSYGPLLDETNFTRAEVVVSDPMLLKLLLSKRLQLGLVSAIYARHALQQASDKVKILLPPLDYVDIYFAFSKHSIVTTEFVQRFDQALREFKTTPAYHALLQRYQLQ